MALAVVSGPKTWNQLPENVRDATLTERQLYKVPAENNFSSQSLLSVNIMRICVGHNNNNNKNNNNNNFLPAGLVLAGANKNKNK